MNRFPLILVASVVTASYALAADTKIPTTKPTDPFEPYTEQLPRTLVKLDMLPIPAGKFLFSPDGKSTPRQIEIKRFWMAKTECTWDQFDVFWLQLDLEKEARVYRRSDATGRPSPPYSNPDHGFGHEGYPALTMTVHSATMYCRWLSEKTGRKYRLPTEAEWEWAFRAASPVTKIDLKRLDEFAWHEGNSQETTHPVMKKKPNAWGLYDMLGNAGEWCTPIAGKIHVLRGGSFMSKQVDVHCLARSVFESAWQVSDPEDPKSKWWLSDAAFAGFRVVREE